MNPFRNFPLLRRGGAGEGAPSRRPRAARSRLPEFRPVRPYESNWNRKAIITPS